LRARRSPRVMTRRVRKAVGFDAHCAKPLTPEGLLRVLESAAALHIAGSS
jgi:hypothetical protein